MRTLSADLLAVQALPDAEATAVVRCKRRGTFAGDPLAWRPLFLHTSGNLPYGDAAVTSSACGCATNGYMLRVLRSAAAGKVGVQRFNVLGWAGDGGSWPTAASAALTATPTQIAALAYADTAESTPGVGRIGSGIFVFYGDRGLVRVVFSGNDGVSWGNFSNAWDGRAVYTRCTNFSVCASGASGSGWMAVFNGYDSGGRARVRAVYSIGAGWVATAELPDDGIDWLVVGAKAGSPYEPEPCVYVYLTGVKSGGDGVAYSVLACQRMIVTAAGAFSAWDGSPKVVDRAGPANGVNYTRARLGEGGGAYLFALQERAVNGYWFVSALYGLPGSLDLEEPVYLGSADLAPTAAEHLTPVGCGRRAWLVGSGGVWASAQADEPANLSVRTWTPTAYTYTLEANGGGVLQVTLPRAQSGQAPPESFGTVAQPEIYIGDILWLDRTLTDGTRAGTKSLAFRVVQVVYGRDQVEVLAADALGVLAHMRPRRDKRLAAYERTRSADVDCMVHWCGLDVSGASSLAQAAWAAPGFRWAANESGLSALRRYLMDQVTALRSAGADTATAHTTVQLLELPAASSYTYVSPAGRAAGLGVHEIADWALEVDSRPARLLAANGLVTAGGSDGGPKAWALAAARALPGARPYPLVLTDYSFAASDGRLGPLAAAQAQWLLFGLPLGWIEAGANLGVELYDVVTVDQTLGRVVGMVEVFVQGRLRQRLALAEVDAFGVSVG